MAIERLARSGRMTAAEARARLQAQSSDKRQMDEVDFTLANDSTADVFEKRARTLMTVLQALQYQALPPAPLHQLDLTVESEVE
jgi:dephospho-CoA kinase